MRRSVLILILLLVIPTLRTAPARAQSDSTAVTTPASPRETSSPGKSAGVFSRGSKRAGIYGGAGSTLGNTYVILGAGIGYYIYDGLEVGIDGEGWLFQDPTIWKISPQIRYTVWQFGALRPYIGAFWRRTFVEDPYDDVDSWGGRGGITYARGRGYVGAGMVYERFDGDFGEDSDIWYPEISFSMYF